MIITHKEFPNYRKFEMDYEGRKLSMEVGKLAELCNAAVLVTYGGTTVLVTCTASARPKDGIERTASTTSPSPWTSTRSSTPSAASPAASCAVRASRACPPCWRAA